MDQEFNESEPAQPLLHSSIMRLLAIRLAHDLVEASRKNRADVHENLELLFRKLHEAFDRRVALDQGDPSGYIELAKEQEQPLDAVLPDKKKPMEGIAKIIMTLCDNRISHADAQAYYAYRCFLLEQEVAVTTLDQLPWIDGCLERVCEECDITTLAEARERITSVIEGIHKAGMDAREWHFLMR